jgi:hypothetical protein
MNCTGTSNQCSDVVEMTSARSHGTAMKETPPTKRPTGCQVERTIALGEDLKILVAIEAVSDQSIVLPLAICDGDNFEGFTSAPVIPEPG